MSNLAAGPPHVHRRSFLKSAAAAAGGVALASKLQDAAASEAGADDLQVALIGAGAQGQLLLNLCAKIPGVRVRAVCDVWSYNRDRSSLMLSQYGHEHKAYQTLDELLGQQQDLDAAIIATPDCFHAQQAEACLKQGLHVYCESPMAISLEDARQITRTSRSANRLLQIGHQRRSNPYYRFCYAHVINETKLLGGLVAANGQWNRPVQSDRGWPRRAPMDEADLKGLGFESMQQFRNWQWYDGLGGGPVLELGAHQIDVFNWFLEAAPLAGFASGGVEHYDPQTHQNADTLMAVLEYPLGDKKVRAFYQTISSNSNSGYFESFMGDQGTLYVSEVSGRVKVFREPTIRDWDKWIRVGYLKSEQEEKEEPPPDSEILLDVEESVAPPSYTLAVEATEPSHQAHLNNFFQAIRGQEPLNCPAETAYAATVVALRLAEAAKALRTVEFRPEDFQV